MKLMATDLINCEVLSLRLGGPIGTVNKILLDETNLKISLFIVAVSGEKKPGYLMPNDVRLSEQKTIIVDSEEKIADKEDMIRARTTIERDLIILGLPVVTIEGKKLGKVDNYIIDNTGYLVSKLYVHTSLLQNIMQSNLIIDRSDIVDVKPNKIIVREATANAKLRMTNVLPVENS